MAFAVQFFFIFNKLNKNLFILLIEANTILFSMKKEPHPTKAFEQIISSLLESGFDNDKSKFESNAINLSRILRKDNPNLSFVINRIVATYSGGHPALRGFNSPMPTDQDSQLDMASIFRPHLENNPAPILNRHTALTINHILKEREHLDELLKKNVRPTSSLLLIGPPGTGKTMLAHHIASALNKNLIVLDLAISISSFLGKTGQNLKKVLKYAKQNPSVLLLDEFDAIAKRRDDSSDLGELKRVVNVLLMELENWPVSSFLIATSNHPELLDRAIWRRFDHVIELGFSKEEECLLLLTQEFADDIYHEKPFFDLLPTVCKLLSGKSPADICKYANNVKRRMVMTKEKLSVCALMELGTFISEKKSRAEFCLLVKKLLGDTITVRDLADITGLSAAGVQYHLVK
ncbi:MAG: ATP-binding protein [Candidatus Babeliales bacterium]